MTVTLERGDRVEVECSFCGIAFRLERHDESPTLFSLVSCPCCQSCSLSVHEMGNFLDEGIPS